MPTVRERTCDVATEVREIEDRTQEQVEALLEAAGLKRDSQEWRDYVKAKRLIFGDFFINPAIHDRQIQWICDYLSV